ncbi:pH regulation protein F, partial [Halobacteriales archaeon QH_6_64_20]
MATEPAVPGFLSIAVTIGLVIATGLTLFAGYR